MKKRIFGRIGIVLALAVLLVSGSCTGVGIFAVVAVSEKIDEGMLPEGISARPVAHISPGLPTDDYYFFASGPGIWAKDKSGGLWKPIPLNSNGTEWDGVQSMAVVDDRIFLALYDVNGDDYKVSIHTLISFDGSTPIYDPLEDQVWTSDSAGYQTIRLFCPVPAGDVYVNIMDHTGVYGSIDSEDNGFIGSNLYLLPNTASTWAVAVAAGTQTELDGTNGARYITGVADSGAVVRITATNNMFSQTDGILLDGTGALVDDFINPPGSISEGILDDYTNVSVTGITWLPRTFGVNGAFIMSATSLDNSTLPMFASSDGVDWTRLGGTTTDFLTTNFIDVSDKTAGQSDSKRLVLAGTSSYIDGSTSHIASGYNEIDVTSETLSDWTVNTTWDDYSFALNTNYSVSDLAQATIIGMSIPEGINDLYASTRNVGVWKIDMGTDKPSWTRE